MRKPRALTIAGSDSGGGAGIQADLKTFAAHRVYGSSVITSVTAQNTVGVTGVQDVTPEMVILQIKAVLIDIGADSIKTGMLSSASIVKAVVGTLKSFRIKNLVVDPVMISKSGHRLLAPDATRAVVDQLLPIADVLTPNLHEAQALLNCEITSVDEMKQAATKLAAMGPRCVVVKGGHLTGDPVDVVYWKKRHYLLRSRRIKTGNTHGTGCTFSSAIAARLALGYDVLDSVRGAKRYITKAIEMSYPIGHGHGPVNHFWRKKEGLW